MSTLGIVSGIKNFLGRQSVLLIDDDESWHRILKLLVERRLGLEFDAVMDSSDGCNAAKDLKPKVILLDWMMPGMSGLNVLRSLRRDPDTRGIPVIMLTGKDKVGDIDKAISYGAVDYICKGDALEKLPEKIQAIVSA